MTDQRVSQAGVEVLFKPLPGHQISQAGVEVLYRVGTDMRASQVGVEILYRVTPELSVSQSGVEFLFKNLPCGTKLAQIWTITRTDDEVFRFTSLDRDLEYPPGSGVTYRACGSLTPSASENVAELDSAGSMDLTGMVGGDADTGWINSWDLYSGKFDGARVDAWLVPWSGEGRVRKLLGGTFAPVELTEAGFRTEIAGDGNKLKQTPLVQTLQPACRWQFGDPITCGKDLGPLMVTGTVDSGDGVREFVDAARAEATGYFKFGRVTFTSGANDGISAEIKEHTAGGNFTLWPRLPFAIDTGVTYEMTPGCTNLKAADGGCNGCTAWGQLARYGGFDKVPGRDKRGKAANVRTS
jgi:uncharacterized phage protein (TIGR02218 family)